MDKKIVNIVVLSLLFVVISGYIVRYPEKKIRAKETKVVEDGNSAKKRLSEMTDDELISFLSEFTKSYDTSIDSRKNLMLALLKSQMNKFDSPGKTTVNYGYTLYAVLAEEIDCAVMDYYEGDYPETNGNIRYTPIQNSLYETPSGLSNYNCYAYAVDRTIYAIDPGFSSNISLNFDNETAFSLATYAKMDLQSSYFNKNCVKITTVCPDDSIFLLGRNAICVRTGSDIYGVHGYHFMKLQSAGWLHKPGVTAILKHLLLLSPSTTWLGEYYDTDYNSWFLDPMEYTGSIYYLIYQTDHSYELQYTGNNYHSGHYHYYEKAHVCTNCGASYGAYYEKRPCSGPPCPNVIGKHFDEIE